MKFAKMFLMFILSLIFLTSCQESATINGKEVPCIGVPKEDANPKYQYKLSTRNVILAVVFSETIIVPVVVLLEETYCPIGEK